MNRESPPASEITASPGFGIKKNFKKNKSSTIVSTSSVSKKQTEHFSNANIGENEFNETLNLSQILYKLIEQEYFIRVSDVFGPSELNTVQNIFSCTDMMQIIEKADELYVSNNILLSKNVSNKTKPTKEVITNYPENDEVVDVKKAET